MAAGRAGVQEIVTAASLAKKLARDKGPAYLDIQKTFGASLSQSLFYLLLFWLSNVQSQKERRPDSALVYSGELRKRLTSGRKAEDKPSLVARTTFLGQASSQALHCSPAKSTLRPWLNLNCTNTYTVYGTHTYGFVQNVSIW